MEFDLENFLKDSSVADLDWLDVDEVQYRNLDTLPKQNLDTQPDLEALWAREGESPASYLVPNKVSIPNPGIDHPPHTMGDMSQAHGKLRAEADEIRRMARLAMMQSSDPLRMREELIRRFGSVEALAPHREILAEVLKERGLLGDFYVDASDFPDCAKGGKQAAFVNRYAADAKYVLAKKACGDCCHATTTTTGATHCGVFHKEIQLEVPYTKELAEVIERSQSAKGRAVQASEGSPRDRIRAAYLANRSDLPGSVYEGQGISQVKQAKVDPAQAQEQLIGASSLLRKKQSAIEAKPVIDFLHKEMVKGLRHDEITRSLKLAFDTDLLVRTREHWRPIFKESGLYGVVYTKQESFADCHKGADFLAKHNPSVRAIVAGSKCGSCIYNKTRCMLYGKPLVKSASEVLTEETVSAVLLEHRTAGRLPAWEKTASNWGDSPAKALRAIHEATRASLPQEAPTRMDRMQGFYGNNVESNTGAMVKQKIAKQAGQYMNEGLYGEDLLTALMSRYEIGDIKAASNELRPVLAEQGLQGVYYVDPAVYGDYGKGCDEAARLHRTRVIEYVKQGSKCGSCVHQTRVGFCSKINKRLVEEPPYVDKKAQQKAVLATGRSTDVSYASLVNNATSSLAEFQMQHELDVQVDAAVEASSMDIQFGSGKVKL